MIEFWPTIHFREHVYFNSYYGIVFQMVPDELGLVLGMHNRQHAYQCQGCYRYIQSIIGVLNHSKTDCAHWRKVDGTR